MSNVAGSLKVWQGSPQEVVQQTKDWQQQSPDAVIVDQKLVTCGEKVILSVIFTHIIKESESHTSHTVRVKRGYPHDPLHR